MSDFPSQGQLDVQPRLTSISKSYKRDIKQAHLSLKVTILTFISKSSILTLVPLRPTPIETTPTMVDITLVAADDKNVETLKLGPATIRILEDGRKTDNRLGAVIMTLPPNLAGPPIHWHRMHDETFLVLKGKMRFTTDKGDVDTKAGDYVVVPTACSLWTISRINANFLRRNRSTLFPIHLTKKLSFIIPSRRHIT